MRNPSVGGILADGLGAGVQVSGDEDHGVSFGEAARVWAGIGLNSFGGPAAQIAVMHKTLVEEKRWIGEDRFLHALNYCMLLPGPEAQQLATYIGWLLHGVPGGLVAGGLFVLPGYVALLALSAVYLEFHDVAAVGAALFGVKAAVLAVVIEAIVRIGKRVLKNPVMVALAVGAFIALAGFHAPFPLVVVLAGAIGLFGGRVWPERFVVVKPPEGKVGVIDALLDRQVPEHARPSVGRALQTAAIWLVIWLAPVGALWAVLGRENVFTRIALFFSGAAVVTFGGAYAVLAYIAQQAVENYHWLTPPEMLDGLGMAETTPGPLIMVVEYVGFLAAARNPGSMSPLLAGFLGATLTTWVTFAPCFLWIFVGAPWVEALRGKRSLTAALSAITAAVVGVIANLALWFGMHVLVHDGAVDVVACGIAIASAVAILRFHAPLPAVLAGAAGSGLLAWALGYG